MYKLIQFEEQEHKRANERVIIAKLQENIRALEEELRLVSLQDQSLHRQELENVDLSIQCLENMQEYATHCC